MSSPHRRVRVPKYRIHRPSGQAVVTLNGHDHYLGPHGTEVSKAEYDRLVGEWMAAGRRSPGAEDSPATTVTKLCVAYMRHAVGYYRKGGKGTSELDNVRDALRPLRQRYGHTLVEDFSPLSLKALRETLIEAGLSRGVINARVNRIRRAFRWGVAEGLVPAEIWHALQAVEGLKKGRSEARESMPVEPVSKEHIEAVLPHVSRQVGAMIRLQALTGMRPGEVVQMRWIDIDTSGEVWVYRPEHHKTEHHGVQRLIPLGPRAQEVLRDFLSANRQAAIFRPCDAEEDRKVRMRQERRTPVQPSQRSRAKARPKRSPGGAYTTGTYYQAVARACRAAKIPRWSPNRLRHTRLTEIQRRFGLDAARACAGHTTPDTTSIYVQRDQAAAREVMAALG